MLQSKSLHFFRIVIAVFLVCGFNLTTGTFGGFINAYSSDFNYPDFSSTDGLNLLGNAAQYNNRLRLTPSIDHQNGAVWHTTKQLVQDGFETNFQFQITEIVGGGDGFAFVIQNHSSLAFYPAGGEEKGYSYMPNSLAVEFDFWHEWWANDPNGNHISVHTRGTEPNSFDEVYSLGFTTDIPIMTDGNIHTVKIEYVFNEMKIFLDDLINPVLTVPVELDTILSLDNGQSWVGFTAATGGNRSSQDILNWSFNTIFNNATASLTCTGTASDATVVVTYENLSDEAKDVEINLWSELPDGSKKSIKGVSKKTFDAGYYKTKTIVENKSLPSGIIYGVRLEDPITGEDFSFDTCGF